MAEPVLSESDPTPAQPGRSELDNLLVGVLAGAGTGGIGAATVAVVLAMTTDLFSLSPQFHFGLLDAALFVGVPATFFGGIMGLPVGLLLALVDTLSGARLRTASFPIWVWLPVGAVLGSVSFTLLAVFVNGGFAPLTIWAPLLGALTGLVAGPFFGWFFRERRQREPTQQGVE